MQSNAGVRRESSDALRAGRRITSILVNLDARRVALLAADGPPSRGFVDTDLPTGAFTLTVDRRNRRWVFDAREVRQQPRFSVKIDGPDPFALEYSNPLQATVTSGLDMPAIPDFAATTRLVAEHVHDRDYRAALATLCELNEVDLYDVIDELWATLPGVVNDVLLHFVEATRDNDLSGQPSALRALESFARYPKELFVDAFTSCVVHPSSFAKNEERARAGLRNVRLQLDFDLIPPRSLLIYADDIDAATEPSTVRPTYGPGCLTYPPALTVGSTPRLHAATTAAITNLERQNVEFIRESIHQVSTVLLSVYQASLSIAKIDAANMARGYQPRAQRGPGQWRSTFEGGSNMSDAAARYELTSCGTPPGMGYFVDGVQFEGFASRTLLDAKFWRSGGHMAKALKSGRMWAGWKVVNQANRQLRVAKARGVDVEWRFASKEVADLVQQIFRANGLPIRAVFIAP
jgi:hypothetical protein